MTSPHTDLFDLSGAVAVVSGASGWLGTEIVDVLATSGCAVVAVGRTKATLEAAFGAGPFRERIHIRTCDVTSASWPSLLADVAREHGRLDVLVNNAHVGRGGSMRTSTSQQFDEAFDLAVKATWRGIEAARPGFAASVASGGSPSVINVGSMYGLVAPDLSVYESEAVRNPPFYGAAKAALVQLSRYAATELGPEGVRVNVISPGPFPQRPDSMDPEFVSALARRTVLGRVGRPDDLRTAVLFLASQHSSFVTGANIVVDGGWTIR